MKCEATAKLLAGVLGAVVPLTAEEQVLGRHGQLSCERAEFATYFAQLENILFSLRLLIFYLIPSLDKN